MYRIFKNVLDKERYDRLKALAFIAHMVESQYLSTNALEDIEILAEYFDEKFSSLYSVRNVNFFLNVYFLIQARHAVSIIHSVRHFHTCVRKYGPMFNYSAFSFESSTGLILIGSLFIIYIYIYIYMHTLTASFLRTIHGKSTTSAELTRNIDLIRQASLCASSSTFSIKGKEYIDQISSSSRIRFSNINTKRLIRFYQRFSSPSSDLLSLWPRSMRHSITLYKTLFINNLRFSADDFTICRCSNDACVLYKSKKKNYSIGFILCVGHRTNNNETYLLVNEVNIFSTADAIHVQGRNFKCTNIMKGKSFLVPTS